MEIHNINDINIFDIPAFTKAKKPAHNRSRYSYNAQICAFDIETTALSDLEQSIMYIWQFAIEDYVIIGRTWEEFRKMVSWLNTLSYNRKIITFVHNLSYEIQFLSGIFHFKNEDVFATESRKVLKANLGNIEFRCSYMLTNLGLKKFTERYKVKHQKLSGDEFDYSKLRFPDTPLTDREIEYCVNDVVGLTEAIHALMDLNNDNVYTLPYTATGFVRRVCKDKMQSQHKEIIDCYPSFEVFKLFRSAFRGGNTHCNRYFADDVIKGPVYSMDITSSYPFQQVCKKFPVAPFEPVKNLSISHIDKLISNEKPVIFRVEFSNVKLRNKYTGIPYIPFDKVVECSGEILDNGRILSADHFILSVTDIDWNIITRQYKFDAIILSAFKSRYDMLPDGLRDANIEFYRKKTELKGVPGQELFYLKNKELLNSIYGMSVQNPVKRSILFNDSSIEPNLYILDDSKSDEDLLEISRKKAFTCYQFGVWTTAHARQSLQAGIDICGDDIIYVDTDSCKFINNHDFSKYNDSAKHLSSSGGLFADDINGITHYAGVYEEDGIYDEFISQGSKKYAYEKNGKIYITVSGVAKDPGAKALYDAGGLDMFRDGLVFHDCGKTESIYNDKGLGYVNYHGHEINITRNVYIKNQDYTLSKSESYSNLVEVSKKDIERLEQFLKNLRI